jgi:hypothetical protein
MEDLSGIRELHESQLNRAIEQELTDEQLQQLAEGSCSWGANCNSSSGCKSPLGGTRA